MIATSDTFEIKAEGADPYRRPSLCYATTPTLHSGGYRLAPGRWADLGAAVLCVAAMS